MYARLLPRVTYQQAIASYDVALAFCRHPQFKGWYPPESPWHGDRNCMREHFEAGRMGRVTRHPELLLLHKDVLQGAALQNVQLLERHSDWPAYLFNEDNLLVFGQAMAAEMPPSLTDWRTVHQDSIAVWAQTPMRPVIQAHPLLVRIFSRIRSDTLYAQLFAIDNRPLVCTPPTIANYHQMARQFVQVMPQRFGDLPASMANNAEPGMLAIQGDTVSMQLVAKSLRDDFAFAVHAMQFWLQRADGAAAAVCLPPLRARLRDSSELVCDALPYRSGLLHLWGPAVRDDMRCVRAAVAIDSPASAAASTRITTDIVLVGDLLSGKPNILPFVPAPLRFNPTIRVCAGAALLRRNRPVEASHMFVDALHDAASGADAALGLQLAAAYVNTAYPPEAEPRQATLGPEAVNQ